MASKKSEQNLKLSAVLDLNEASALHGKLLGLRGSDIVIDASAVERCGTQCVQVLIAGAKAWEEDKKTFTIGKTSDAFEKTMQLIGINFEQLLGKEIRQ
jgi:chemotaxis protein CheX